MSTITLTIPIDDDRPNSLVTFAYTRDRDGRGHWSTKTSMGGLPPNCLVHTELQQSLTTLAKERKVKEKYNFASKPPTPPKPEKVPRGPRTKKAKGPVLMGGFNPFG